jgi:uncharacterized membrane protein YgaE (UPF0421/DUF939 family)
MVPCCGHYECSHIGQVIGACLAYRLTSVIVQFPDYFDPLLITVVVFILALVCFLLFYFTPLENHADPLIVAVLPRQVVKWML